MMQTQISDLFQAVKPASVPDGDYPGTWGGYVVDFCVGPDRYQAKTTLGVRTIDMPCVVRVSGGEITIVDA